MRRARASPHLQPTGESRSCHLDATSYHFGSASRAVFGAEGVVWPHRTAVTNSRYRILRSYLGFLPGLATVAARQRRRVLGDSSSCPVRPRYREWPARAGRRAMPEAVRRPGGQGSEATAPVRAARPRVPPSVPHPRRRSPSKSDSSRGRQASSGGTVNSPTIRLSAPRSRSRARTGTARSLCSRVSRRRVFRGAGRLRLG